MLSHDAANITQVLLVFHSYQFIEIKTRLMGTKNRPIIIISIQTLINILFKFHINQVTIQNYLSTLHVSCSPGLLWPNYLWRCGCQWWSGVHGDCPCLRQGHHIDIHDSWEERWPSHYQKCWESPWGWKCWQGWYLPYQHNSREHCYWGCTNSSSSGHSSAANLDIHLSEILLWLLTVSLVFYCHYLF